MYSVKYVNILAEAVEVVNRPFVLNMSEAAQLQVTDEVLTGMMKFITDKYNSLDFGEIERSAGDISRFKYTEMIRENAEMLKNIYEKSGDPGAKKYAEVANSVLKVLDHLRARRDSYRTLYQSGNGLIQLLYTSLVAACVYSVGILVSNTIRFVTTETDTDCQVMFDEIPGSAKNVHIRNVVSAAQSIDDFNKLLDAYQKEAKRPMHEAVGPIAAGLLTVGLVIYLIPKILILIREIIYSIYFLRVRVGDMLAVQIDLINTNIESLYGKGGSERVIAKQTRVVEKLEKWKNRIAIKVDSVNALVSVQKKRENQVLNVEPDSPIICNPEIINNGDLML